MDRLDAMEILLKVIEQGSLSVAGRRLGLPLTTVRRKIAGLETHLGARLLLGSNRNVSLTEAGGACVAACKLILSQVAKAA